MIEIVEIKDGKYHFGEVSGSTVDVTLRRVNEDGSSEMVSCDGILIWELDDEDEDSQEELENTFEEWKGCAEEGEEGYFYVEFPAR